MKEATAQVVTLNRNLTHILQVGQSFEETANTWTGFIDTFGANENEINHERLTGTRQDA